MSSLSRGSLKQKFIDNSFLLGVELTSSRGKLSESKMQKTIQLGNDVSQVNDIDWISITDNAGGHPTLRPTTLGRPFLDKGKEVIVHLTCKDMNRNALESTAWTLASEGFENILALTGDYPQKDYLGGAKPVFDLDSVTLLEMISKMNRGIETGYKKKFILEKTSFFLGAAFNNNKKNENELLPQYSKLLQKLKNGADFIIPQVGFDAKKMQELKFFMSDNGFQDKPLIGNIYLLSKFTSNLFHKNRIPGIALTDKLHSKCMKAADSSDKGKSFFIEFAAKMLSITKGLGYNGAYFGGVHNVDDIIKIIELELPVTCIEENPVEKIIAFKDEAASLLQSIQKIDPAAASSNNDNIAAFNTNWTTLLEKHYPSSDSSRCLLTLYALPGAAAEKLFLETFGRDETDIQFNTPTPVSDSPETIIGILQ